MIPAAGFVAFDLAEKLRAFGFAVVEESVDVLLQITNGLAHLRIERLRLVKTGAKLAEGLVDLAVLGHDGVARAGDRLVLGLLGLNSFVQKQIAIDLLELFHQCRLLVIGLKKSILVRTEFLQFGLEELLLVIGDRLLIENQDIRDVIIADLCRFSIDSTINAPRKPTLSFKSFKICIRSRLTRFNLFTKSSTLAI